MKKILSFFIPFCLLVSACSAQATDHADIKGKVLFYSNRDDGKWGVYLYDGNKVKRKVESLIFPTWFPDGQNFLAVGGRSRFFIVDLFGKKTSVIDVDESLNVVRPRVLRDQTGFAFIGEKRLRRLDGVEMSIGVHEVYFYDFKDKSVRQLTAINEIGHIYSFDVSPDGDWIAYSWAPQKGETKGVLLNVKTKEEIKIDDYVMSIGWSPDGKTILYEGSNQNGKRVYQWSGLFSYDVASKKTTLINKSFGTTGFRFSPDGKKLIYSNWYQNGICLFVYDIATQKSKLLLPLKQINGEGTNDSNPEWHI